MDVAQQCIAALLLGLVCDMWFTVGAFKPFMSITDQIIIIIMLPNQSIASTPSAHHT
jgi:hypothetical protein